MVESPGRSFHPFRSIRARTGLIFFAGLMLLVALTLIITLLISMSIRHDSARLALMARAGEQLVAWSAAADASGRSPLPAEVGALLEALLEGGRVRAKAGDFHLRQPGDEAERLALERAFAAWQALLAADGERADAAVAAVQAALAEAEPR